MTVYTMIEFLKKTGLKLSFITGFIKEKKAAVLPFAALAFPVVLGMVGLGADGSMWMSNKRVLQTAADAAVIAAGWEVAQDSPEYMTDMALKEAQINGYKPARSGEMTLDIIEDNPDGSMILGVTLSQETNAYFSRVVYNDPIRISAYAEAMIDGMDGRFCMLGLDPDSPGTVSTSGSATVRMEDCGIASNSTNRRSLDFGGNAEVTTVSVQVSGGYEIGSNVDFEYRRLRSNAPPVEDPYSDLEVPEYERCTGKNNGTSFNSSVTVSPGVFCGGINISGNNDIYFEPGVYIIDGGEFKVSGGGTLYGEGVTFILTGNGNDYAGVDISGSRDIEFSAPLAGEDMEGVVFFQDPRAPSRNNEQNKIVGSSEIVMNGAMYFPSQGLWYGGDSSFYNGDTPCTKIIARTVTLTGNPLLGNNCERVAVRNLGAPNVRLIR